METADSTRQAQPEGGLSPEPSTPRRARRRGLVLVFTGNGKGKTTAALGMALRAVGHGFRVKVVQFIKAEWLYGEHVAARRLGPELEIVQSGRGFTLPELRRKGIPREEHVAAAAEALRLARESLGSGDYRMVVLDEVLYALSDGLVSLEDVLGLIAARPAGVHLVLTGRGAPPEIVAVADLVTEMREIKHHYAAGVPGQRGIEF